MPVTGLPKTETSPSLGGSSPEISASVVDLPQPVGPTTAQNSPGSTAMSRFCRAVKTVPDGVRNRLVTRRSSMAGDIALDSGPGPQVNAIHPVVVAVLVVLVAARNAEDGLGSPGNHPL